MNLPIEELRGSVLRNIHEVTIKADQVDEIKKEEIKLGSDLCGSGIHLVEDNSRASASVHVVVPSSDVYVAHSNFLIDPEVYVAQDPTENLSSIVKDRLKYSKYLIDPNKFRFSKIVRILAIVIRVAKVLMKSLKSRQEEDRILKRFSVHCPPEQTFLNNPKEESDVTQSLRFPIEFGWINLLDQEIQFALNYLFKKTTDELKHFVPAKDYENLSVEKDGILYYVGRVFTYDIEMEDCGYGISETMLDLTKYSFVVPIVDRYSPVAFSIVNDIHWNHHSIHTRHTTSERP